MRHVEIEAQPGKSCIAVRPNPDPETTVMIHDAHIEGIQGFSERSGPRGECTELTFKSQEAVNRNAHLLARELTRMGADVCLIVESPLPQPC